jgi:hypothetical protein
MKNGGWLDNYGKQENYNDYKVSAPEGMVGDGFSNVGRNYSPAWGGSFQEGGEIPNAQSGRATRADSLDIYNRALKIDAYYENLKKKGWYPRKEISSTYNLTSKELEKEMKRIDKESRVTYKEQAKEKKGEGYLNNTYPNADPKKVNQKALAEHIALTKGTKYATKDNYPSIIDPMAPTTVIDTRIIPKERVTYFDREWEFDQKYLKSHPKMTDKDYDNLEKLKGNKFKNTQPPGGSLSSLYRYDPLSVKPWDMLTDAEKKARVEKYGTDGVPKSYLNKSKPATTVKPSTKKLAVNTKKKPIVDPNNKPLVNPTKRNVEGLKPMNVAGLQDIDNEFETNLDIPTPVQRKPKYYNITDVNNQNFGGGATSYRVDSLDELRELPKEQWDRKITPQYQMGGNIYPVNYVPQAQGGMSMPGAVGFSYARIGAPSKGPRRNQTDVTDASAQNGKEMQYYREGLDWKPKSIGQNGLELPSVQSLIADTKNRKNQSKVKGKELKKNVVESTRVKNRNLEDELVKEQRTYVDQLGKQMAEEKRRAKLTQDQREREDYNTYNQERGSIEKYVPESTWDRTKAIVSNPLTAFGYAARNQSLPKNFQYGERNVLDNAIDWINPLQGAAALSEIPGELGRGEYLNAGLSTLDALDLGVYAKGAMKASKPFFQKAGQQLGNIPTSIAPELRQGLRTAGSSINNIGKKSIITDLKQGLANFNPKNLKSESGLNWMKQWYSDPDFARRYNPTGQYNSPSVQQYILDHLNEYQPKNYIDLLKDKGVKNYGKLSATSGGVSWGVPESIYHNRTMYAPFNRKGLESVKTHELTHLIENNGSVLSAGDEQALLRPFEIPNVESIPENPGFFRREMLGDNPQYFLNPTEIHARMNQARFDLGLTPKDEFTEKMFDKISKDKGWYGMGRYIKDKDGMMNLMNNFWTAAPVTLGAGALYQNSQQQELTPQYKKGGIIKDDRGQWAHPGEITEINSPYITMQGVPYPVLGISDTGDMQMMYPEEEYEFDGEKVTEYPMAKNGRRQEQKGLQNLDNLLNFTNYNKPQPGGWLNKYN